MRRWVPQISSGIDPATLAFNYYNNPVSGATNGNRFTSWPDTATGTPNTMSGGGATYRTNNLNGHAVAEFNGTSSDNFITGGSTASTYPYSFWGVIKVTNFTNASVIVGSGSASGVGGITFRVNSSTGTLSLLKSQTANIGTSSSSISAATWAIVSSSVDSGNYKFFINGVAAGSGSNAQTLTASRTICIGCDYANGSVVEVLLGFMAECGVSHTYWTDAQHQGVYNYLRSVYAL